MVFRLLLVPLVIAILTSSSVYFILPEFFSESRIVSMVAEFTLNSSNSIFEAMPAVLAKYIAVLDLPLVALTAGVITMVSIQLLVIIGGCIYYPLRWAISLLTKKKIKIVIRDLPAIAPDSGLYKPTQSKKILGRGFDTVETNPN